MTQQADAGRRVGRFEIIKRLGGGGLTDAFLARPFPPAAELRFVVLKQLSATARGYEAAARAFLEDARVTAGLMHPHVARVFNAAVDPARGEPYLAVEFVRGTDLKTLVDVATQRGFQLPLHIACRVVHDVCLGLHAGHLLAGPAGRRLGVVHGSVTPGNVMVAWTGQVKLLDFGLSRARSVLRQAFPGQLFGTLAYSSPEQILDHPMEPRSDVFSAGTVLFELLTGRRMHESDAAALRAVVMNRPPPPSSLAADVPAKLEAAVLAALEKNVDDRPASAADFAGAIAAAAPLAEDSEVAALMDALFEDRRRALDALLERWSRDEDDEEEKTASMPVPLAPDANEETDWPTPATSPWEATQQFEVVPVPSQALRAALGNPLPEPGDPSASGRRAPAKPGAPPPPRAPGEAGATADPTESRAPPPPATAKARPLPAEELFAPPPPPATAKARPLPAEELFAPPPPPAAAKARPLPAEELFAPPPPPATARPSPVEELPAQRQSPVSPALPDEWAAPSAKKEQARESQQSPEAALAAKSSDSVPEAPARTTEQLLADFVKEGEAEAPRAHVLTPAERRRRQVALVLALIATVMVAWFLKVKWFAPLPDASSARSASSRTLRA